VMTRQAAILQAILRLGQCYYDQRHEPYVDWQVRADTIAEAIDTVSRTNEEAAFLVFIGWHESRFSLQIHCGRLTRHKRAYYWGLWQAKMNDGDVYSWALPTLYPTKYMADLALDLYRAHRGHGTLIDGIRGYGGYKRWSPTPRILAARIRRIEKRLDEMTAEKEMI
jgi:hypothetical protein